MKEMIKEALQKAYSPKYDPTNEDHYGLVLELNYNYHLLKEWEENIPTKAHEILWVEDLIEQINSMYNQLNK